MPDSCVEPVCSILLVAAANSPGSVWDFSSAYAILGKRAQSPPLGLLQIAAMLPQERYSVRLVDCNVTPLRDQDIARADMLFVSGLSTAASSMQDILARARRLGRPTVVGGPHALLYYGELDADCFVLGETESVWDSFLADLDAGTLRKAYAFTLSEEERSAMQEHFGEGILFGQGDCPPDMRFIATPRYDLLDLNAYYMMAVQTTRGCPCKCEFCDIWRRYGRKPRHRPPDSVIADLERLYALGWRGLVLFADDNIIGNRSYARELLTKVARWQVERRRPFFFASEGSLNLAEDKELLELFAAAKLTTLFIGLETPCVESLAETNKYINLKGSMASRIAILQEHGLDTAAGFIIGFDSDPPDIARQMADAVQQMGIPLVMAGLLLAVPNSDLFDRMAAQGRLLQQNTKGLSNSHSFITNFAPARPMREVAASYRDVLTLLYPEDMKSYFERCLTFLNRRLEGRRPLARIFADLLPGVKPLATRQEALKGKTVLGPAVLLRALGATLAQPYRWNALAFLWRIARTRRRHIGTAVGFVVLAAHFRRVTRSYLQAAAFWDELEEAARAMQKAPGVVPLESAKALGLVRQNDVHALENAQAAGRAEPLPPGHAAALALTLARIEKGYARLGRDAAQAVESFYLSVRDDLRAALQ